MTSRWRQVAIGGIALVLSPSCAVNGLSFVADTRVAIVQPVENAEVSLPFTVEWTAEDIDDTYAVFFDRSPMRPNQSLLSLVPEGDPCRAERDCPTADWLAGRNIYVTSDTSIEIETLPDLRNNNRSKDRHEVAIVLLNADGRRVGELAVTREFIVERD